jgi:hypothetical protein
MSDHLFCQYSKRWGYLQAGGRIRFSAEKPRRLRHATGMSLRAAFRIHIPGKKKNTIRKDGVLFWWA